MYITFLGFCYMVRALSLWQLWAATLSGDRRHPSSFGRADSALLLPWVPGRSTFPPHLHFPQPSRRVTKLRGGCKDNGRKARPRGISFAGRGSSLDHTSQPCSGLPVPGLGSGWQSPARALHRRLRPNCQEALREKGPLRCLLPQYPFSCLLSNKTPTYLGWQSAWGKDCFSIAQPAWKCLGDFRKAV